VEKRIGGCPLLVGIDDADLTRKIFRLLFAKQNIEIRDHLTVNFTVMAILNDFAISIFPGVKFQIFKL
jgi:hypothetical protein